MGRGGALGERSFGLSLRCGETLNWKEWGRTVEQTVGTGGHCWVDWWGGKGRQIKRIGGGLERLGEYWMLFGGFLGETEGES